MTMGLCSNFFETCFQRDVLFKVGLKLMINVFYFILKAFFFLKIFKILSRLFGHVGKTA